MQNRLSSVAIAFVIGLSICGAASADPAQYFRDANAAQRHCPNDTVVWLNIPSHIYHFPGTRWYGATKSGAFVCEREADDEGDRAARNGQ